MTTVSSHQGNLPLVIGYGKFMLYIELLLWIVFIVVTVTTVILVLIAAIIFIVCLKHNKTKTVDKSNVIKPQTTYYMSVLYIIDELPNDETVTVNKTSPVSNEVIEEWS